MKDEIIGKELEALNKLIAKEEKLLLLPYKNFSGGFVESNVFDYDDEIIDVELKYGVQSDTDDTVYTETLKINRKTMEWTD
jgi:hypothetical protein